MLQSTTAKKPAAVPSREELLRRAEALVPVLEQRAAKAEELRRCPDETIRDYIDNDLLRICQPAPYGGFELGYDVLCEVSQTLARGCGSQGWVHMVLADNILKLASYSAQAQEDVWGKDTTAKLSNCVTPVGKGRPMDGGVIWSGRHTFSSGVDHAQWVMAAGTIDHGDRKQACSVLVPKSDITIIDDWHVIGLAGTGSNTFVINEAFVPAHRILDKKASDEGNAPGAKLYAAPVFHMPRGGPSAASFASVAVGIAEGFLEGYYKYTRPRKSRGTPVGALVGTQITAATSATEIEAAVRMYLGVAARSDGRPGARRAVHQASSGAGQAQRGLCGAARHPCGAAALQRRRRPRALHRQRAAAEIPRRARRRRAPLPELAQRRRGIRPRRARRRGVIKSCR